MIETNGDIKVRLDEDGRVVLTLMGFPAGGTKVSISPDKWGELVTEVIHQRSALRTKANTRAFTVADAAMAVEAENTCGARYEGSSE